MNIYAIRTSGSANDKYIQPKIFKHLESGIARFGWSYTQDSNLYEIENKLEEYNWDYSKLDEDQAYIWSKSNFLLRIEKGDYLVYINQPSLGLCTVLKVKEKYGFDEGIYCDDLSEYSIDSRDYRHIIKGDFIGIFDRNNTDLVKQTLRKKLVLRGRWWKIKDEAETEFKSFLSKLPETDVSKDENYQKVDNDIEEAPLSIFISYSRKDKKYLKELLVYLKPLQRLNLIKIWTDRNLESGEKWEEKIESEIENSQVAILLVSSSFFSSDFITKEEIPKFLEKNEKDGLDIKPIIINPCESLYLLSELKKYNAFNGFNKTLKGKNEYERELLFLLRLTNKFERDFFTQQLI